MGIHKATCYFLECDKCEGNQDGGDIAIPHFETSTDAEGDGRDHEWGFYKDTVWCEACTPLCTCGHAHYAHGYYDDTTCETCDCPAFCPEEAHP